jgi:RNA-directed DNA polymerase
MAKPYNISKDLFVEAWRKVKGNRGSPGVDGVTLDVFGSDIRDNLYKIWNRMSSGSYFPPPVKTVEIPKKSGGHRPLGIPCVSDRVAQMVIRLMLEPLVEPVFHVDSYGYRPKKSALDAIEVTRKRCWKYEWLVEFDIKGLFDNIPSELILKAVRHHTDNKCILLYVERWLQGSVQSANGTLTVRNKGVPQGGVISPVLSNLFMHYAFDMWMQRSFPEFPFCRYADDGLVHCKSENQALFVKQKLSERFEQLGLEVHPHKTKIVYCSPRGKRGEKNYKFEFLGYEFRRRLVRSKAGNYFVGFTPSVSPRSAVSIRQKVRKWKLYRLTNRTLFDLARFVNPVIQGWINYFGAFQRSELKRILRYINLQLIKWVKRKYKKRGKYFKRARDYLSKVITHNRELFAHWRIGVCL